jgi:hypothetical protein
LIIREIFAFGVGVAIVFGVIGFLQGTEYLAIHHPVVIGVAAVIAVAYVVGKVVVAFASVKERLH